MNNRAKTIALAHRVFAHEDFDQTAQMLLGLLHNAQRQFPGAKRSLFLEIDGHRNFNGGFDDDMLELQSKFMQEFLLQFLTRAVTPLGEFENPKPQNNEIPEELDLVRLDPPPLIGSDGSPQRRRF